MPKKNEEGKEAYSFQSDAPQKGISKLGGNEAQIIQTKEELIETSSLLSSFFNSPGAMRGIVEIEGNDIRHIADNAETAAFFGRSQKSMRNALASEMGVNQDFVDIWIKYYEESKKSKKQLNFKYEHEVGTRSYFFSVTVNYIGESERGFSRYTYVVFDITEHREAQKALQKAHDELDRRVEERTAELAQSNRQLRQEIEERKRLERELMENRRLLEESQLLAHLGSWEWHIDTNANVWSDEMFRIFGHEPGAMVPSYDVFSKALHPDDKERVLGAVHRAVEEDLPYAADYRIIRPDGSERIVHATGNMHRDKKGRPLRMVGAVLDITEQKRSEEELKEALTKLSALIEASPIAITFLDVNGDVILWSPAAERIFGWKAKEVIGQRNPIVSSEKKSEFEENLRRVLAGKTIDNVEVKRNRKDGSAIDISLSVVPLRDATGRISGVAGLMTDVTDRKEAEDRLRYSEERFRELSEAAFEGIAFTQQGKFVDINSRLAEMLGCAVSDIIGRKVLDFVAPESRVLVSDRIEKGFEGRYEHLAKKWDGSVFPAEVQSRLVHHKGAVFRVTAVRDITERKDLEERLRQSHKMEAIGTLAGGIAHDFNNVLGIILGNTELAMDDVPEWNPVWGNLEATKTACLRAKDVVRQVLSFARKTEEERKPVRIAPIITGALRLLRSSIPASIEIRHNMPKVSETVLANPTQINQIMINLCTNAAQAMEEDGGLLEINLESVTLEKPNATYRDLSSGPYVKLTVRDNGHGISPEIKGRIFDPYFTTREVGKGSGMGLAVVHGIVSNHGGAITVDSEPGEGTRIEVFLPVTEEEPFPETVIDEELPTGKERILFVDDEESVLRVGSQRLERLGYQVEATTSPLEALDLFRSHPDRFDLVITDLTMPGMPGDTLVKEILSIRRNLPIILCTGFSDKITEEKAKEIGASAYLEKPHDKRELAGKVRQVLDGEST